MYCFDDSNCRENAEAIDRYLDEIEKPQYEQFRTSVIQLGKLIEGLPQLTQGDVSFEFTCRMMKTLMEQLSNNTPSSLLRAIFEQQEQHLPYESRIAREPYVNSFMAIIHIIQRVLNAGGRDQYIRTRTIDEILERENRLKYPCRNNHANTLFEAFEGVHLESMLRSFGCNIRDSLEVQESVMSATVLARIIEQLPNTNMTAISIREAFTLLDDITLFYFMFTLGPGVSFNTIGNPHPLLNFVKAIFREGGLSNFIENHAFHAKKFSEELESIPNFNSEALSEADKASYNNLIDPITLSLINDPITAPNGQTYDRVTLAQYFKSKDYPQRLDCPNTRLPIHFSLLTNETNVVLKNMISHFVDAQKNKAHQQQAAAAVSAPSEALGNSSSQLYQMPRNISSTKKVTLNL